MKFKDYYQILGVEADAEPQQIKRAYRKKARQFHPDVSTERDAEDRFKEVNEAYEALRDPDRRAEYDQLRRHGFRGGDDFRRPPNWHGDWGFDTRAASGAQGHADFSDFFSSLFNQHPGAGHNPFGGQSRQAPFGADYRAPGQRRGQAVTASVSVSLEQAYAGCKKNVTIAAGNNQLQRTLAVTIPAGVTDGQQLRLKGQGRPGQAGGPAGDLTLSIRLQRHDYFEVNDKDISLDLPLTPYEASCGKQLEVPTLGGAVRITIAPGARSGSRMRLRGRGLGRASERGDQFLVLQIQLPDALTAEDRQLLKQFDQQTQFDPREHLATEGDGVRH